MKTKTKEFFFAEAKKFPVSGQAVKSGISLNGIFYSGEELKKFSKTMAGVPIIKDHNASVDNVIGVVESAGFDNNKEAVPWSGWIKDTVMETKIKDKRVKNVSIGALVEKLVKEDDDSDVLIAVGMTCCELSTVVVPGVPGSTINQSLDAHKKATTTKEKLKIPAINEDVNAFKLFKKENKTVTVNDEEVNTKMAELETVKNELKESQAKVKAFEDAENAKKAKEEFDAKVKEEAEKLAEEKLTAYKKEQEDNEEPEAKPEEEPKAEPEEEPKAEPEDKTKGDKGGDDSESDSESEPNSESIKIGLDTEGLSKGQCIYREDYNDSNLNRLRRD